MPFLRGNKNIYKVIILCNPFSSSSCKYLHHFFTHQEFKKQVAEAEKAQLRTGKATVDKVVNLKKLSP